MAFNKREMKKDCFFTLSRVKAVLFFVLLFLASHSHLCSSLSAQTARFYDFNVRQGLRLKYSTPVIQDSSGNIWFGSNEGIFRYNGEDIVNYHPNNKQHYIPVQAVQDLILDPKSGRIYFHGDNRIFCLDPLTHQYQEVDFPGAPLRPGWKRGMKKFLDNEGGLWVVQWQNRKEGSHYILTVYRAEGDGPLEQRAEMASAERWFKFFGSIRKGHLFLNFEHAVLEIDQEGKILTRHVLPRGLPGGHFWDQKGNFWVITQAQDIQTEEELGGGRLEQGVFYRPKESDEFQEFRLKDNELILRSNQLVVEEDRIFTFGFHFSIIDRKKRDGVPYAKEIARLENFALKEHLSFSGLFRDLSGTYWLSGNFLKKLEFQHIDHILQGGSSFCNDWKCSVRKITEDEKGNVIFGTSHRVLQYNPQTREVGILPCDRSIQVWDTWGITLVDSHLYVDNRMVDLEDCSFKFIIGKEKASTYNTSDKEGNIWFGAWGPQLTIYHPETDTRRFLSLPHDKGEKENIFIRTFFPQKNGSGMWVLTGNHGLFLVDKKEGVIREYQYDPENDNSLLSGQNYDARLDEKGDLWIGSSMGLSKLMVETNSFSHYTLENGLASPMVYSILPYEDKGLWLGTANGISYFDLATETFLNFTTENGLGNTEYNTHAAYRSKEGRVYFGGLDGIDAFYPEDLLSPKVSENMPILLTGFSTFREKLEKRTSHDLDNLKKIILPPDNKYFELNFRLADYRSQAENLYRYKLEDYDQKWSPPSKQNFLRYENLPPGRYTLRVKASITPVAWNKHELKIDLIKQQFWYKTRLAYAVYLLLALGLVYRLYRFELDQRLKKKERENLREMDALKTKLYANITHEFRTPLTVIQGMAGQIQGNEEARQMIQRNSKNLLHLVNQLLDMASLESQSMSLQLTKGDIIPYLKYLTQSFESYAETRQIKLAFSSELSELIMSYDAEKLQYIISNLLSNAIKFTPEGGEVILRVSESPANSKGGDSSLRIKVKDTGIGIAEKDLPHIFNRFFRVDSTHTQVGTGIGMALTKELVELIGGRISVKSQQGIGTEFMVLLPVISETLGSEGLEKTAPVEPEKLSSQILDKWIPDPIHEESSDMPGISFPDLPLLLLIEDNLDVSTYITNCLENMYNIQTALDGQAGIEKALEVIPDIIISDVMMPKKDGFEVVKTLRDDIRTSHIPIILLTAKADRDSRITGLERGADAYLSKPFDKEELFISLRNLLSLKNRIQQYFSSAEQPAVSSEPALQKEEAFLKSIREIVENRIDEDDFSVPDLCREIGISQSQLYRKVKALTNRSIAAYIRTIRLQKGKVLLETTTQTVSEIAYQVGFKDPLYFSKTFSQEFGFPPSQIRSS
jgi:signal transduction histidine kinase/DNA-binding response OmpR family regulator